MSGYLSRLADRLAGARFDQTVSPAVGAFAGHGRRIAGETFESEDAVSSPELPAAEWVSDSFERRPRTNQERFYGGMPPASSEPRTALPEEANSPGAVRKTRLPTEAPEDFSVPLESSFGGPGRTNKRSNLVDRGHDMSTSGFSLRGNSGLRQQEDLEDGAALQIEGDVFPSAGWMEAELLPRYLAGNAPAKAEMGDQDPTEEGKPRTQSPGRTPREASDSMPFETAGSRLEPDGMAETTVISRLSPRQMIPPPPLPEAPEQPKLVIGRLSVEVVQQSDPPLKRPVHAGSATPNRSGTRPSGHDMGPRTNLNFGLGQV